MKISEETLNNISALSKIKIDDDIKPKLIEDLEAIMAMVDEMNKIDTDKVEPMSHPIGDAQNLREDISDNNIDRDAFQKHAPKTDDGFYLTPKVIEQND